MATAVLFPGQGSQEPGMGRDLAEADREYMELWKKAEKVSGIELRSVYWEGSEKDMAETRCLQPALTVVNINLWKKIAARTSPAAVAGHSLGEFSALAAAQILPIDTLLELVSLRGRLMSEADPQGNGAMAAVLRLSLPQVEECVNEARQKTGEEILVANHNTPSQFVVSGAKTAVAVVQEAVKPVKGRAVPLAVSGAFHSPLMAEAAAEFSKALDAIPGSAWNRARFSVYCNAEPVANHDPHVIKQLMARQMTSPVLWIDTIRHQWDDGCRKFAECGPKGVLSRMISPILLDYAPAADMRVGDVAPWHIANVGNMQQAEEYS